MLFKTKNIFETISDIKNIIKKQCLIATYEINNKKN